MSEFLSETYLEKELTGLMNRNPKKISLTISYFINTLSFGFLCNTPHVQLLNKVNETLSKDLDIRVIIQRLKELEKIKKLFLSEHQ